MTIYSTAINAHTEQSPTVKCNGETVHMRRGDDTRNVIHYYDLDGVMSLLLLLHDGLW